MASGGKEEYLSGLLNDLCGRKRRRRVESCVMIPGAVGVVFLFLHVLSV